MVDKVVYNLFMDDIDTIEHTKISSTERILLTAHKLFYRDGIRATGINQIIAESGVAKRTFYRCFPAKNDLIIAFLEYWHLRWIGWFEDALHRYGESPRALTPALAEWFESKEFRGCAFINAMTEIGSSLPAAIEISNLHKRDMTALIFRLLPASSSTADIDAQALSIAVDGAILRAQFGGSSHDALASLARVIVAIDRSV